MMPSYNDRQTPRLWRGKRRRDPHLLARLLQQEPPDAATDIPVRVTFGPLGLIGIVGYLAFPVASFAILHFIFDFRTVLGLFLGVGSVLLELAAALPHFDNLNRAVAVSAEGVRLEKIHRTYVIPWWQVQTIEASPDGHRMRIVGGSTQITFSATQVPRQQVETLIQTIRGHGREHGIDVAEMSRRQRFKDSSIPTACHIGAAAIFLVGIYFAFPGTLGMRCSVNSAYLKERYGTPDRQGCVVLRVSAGAASAGVKVGDLMIEFEGYPVTSGQQFSQIFDRSSKPWDVTVIRKGEPEPLHFHVNGGWGKTFQEDNTDPIFYYLRARWDASGDPESSIKDYTRAIQLAPDFDLAYLYRGGLLEERGGDDAGLADIRQALLLSPDLAEAHSYYSYATTDPPDALDHIQTAIRLSHCEGAFERLNIDCATDYLKLSSLELIMDPEKSLATALQSIKFYDAFADPYLLVACGYSRIGQLETAKQYAEKYLAFPVEDRTDYNTEKSRRLTSGEGTC